MMKVVDKAKELLLKMGTKGKVFGLVALAIGNITSIVSISIAWFSMGGEGANINMVSGDLNVDIKKVTAYKKVYPYFKGSAEFVNYNSEPTLKKYVIEDHDLMDGQTKVDDITFTNFNVTFTMSNPHITSAYSTTESGVSFSNLHYDATKTDMYYYLVGDSLFTGDNHPWSTTSGIAFASKENLNEAGESIVLKNVVISAGASFSFFDKFSVNDVNGTCSYYTFTGTTANSPFRIVSETIDEKVFSYIKCLESGSYDITYTANEGTPLVYTLNIERSNRRDSIISNNSLDPTKINIDYLGSTNKNNYPNVNDYLPTAIYNQNTMMILDVELRFKNVNPVIPGLQVERRAKDNNKNINGEYNNGRKHLNGGDSDTLRASDFYSFFPLFTKLPYGASIPTNGTDLTGYYSNPELTELASGTADGETVYYKDGTEEMWNDLHMRTNLIEEPYEISIKHDGDWSDLLLVGRSTSGDGVNTEYYRNNVYLQTGDLFNVVMGNVVRKYQDIKSAVPAASFRSGEDGNIEVRESGLYDILVSVSPDEGKYISIQSHEGGQESEDSDYVINITTNTGSSTIGLISKDSNTEYYAENVFLEVGDTFDVDLNGSIRNWSAVDSTSSAYANFADNGGDTHQIKTMISDSYDITVKVTPEDGKSITIAKHGNSIFSKFRNKYGDFDTTIDCKLYARDGGELIVDPSYIENEYDDNMIYHCYIGIEYDYAFAKYFLNENRLGKTYYLYRDYGFYFTGTQALES